MYYALRYILTLNNTEGKHQSNFQMLFQTRSNRKISNLQMGA